MPITDELLRKTHRFTLDILKFGDRFPEDGEVSIIVMQLMKSGLQVGTNYRWSRRAFTKGQMAVKLDQMTEELDECLYWFDMLVQSGTCRASEVAKIRADVEDMYIRA